jgi:2,3-bisphosphoglycerate-dependent phosphoglycerate mutase
MTSSHTTLETLTLVRHACSQANDDPTLYLRMPDHVIPLSRPEDDAEALASGAKLAALQLDREQVCAWTSTYLRCHQTHDLMVTAAFGIQGTARLRESFLLREQEFGDWDGLTEADMERIDPARFQKRKLMSDHLGRFYFRYPNGESRADVAMRVVSFIAKIHRSSYPHQLVFLHGVTQRALRMTWFNRSVEWFENEPNPKNASLLQIYKQPSGAWAERYL